MSLKDIYCQDKPINILQKALEANKLGHAYIFAGAEGVGKLKTAREFSKMLLCKNPVRKDGFTDSCGSCESCRLQDASSHPDFGLVYKELREFTRKGKGKTAPVDLPIDVIREFLIEKLSAKPTLSKRKIFVLNEAEKLNPSSQNSMLKALEQPPGYCTIILICTRLEKLLPTIKSRCQTIRFGPVDEDRIIDKLKETDIDSTKAKYFAGLAQGSLGQAHRWAGLERDEAGLYETKKTLVNTLAVYQYEEALDVAQQFVAESQRIAAVWIKLETRISKIDINRRSQKILMRIIISALSDAMKLNVTPEKGIINFDQRQQIEELASRFDAEQLAGKIADVYNAITFIDRGVNTKLIFEQLLLSLCLFDTMRA